MGDLTGNILIRGARQLLTLRGPKGPRRGPELQEPGIISDGSLLIRNGVIEEIGSTRRIENLVAARNALDINANGRVVMPGFVDCHTHLVFPPPGVGLCDHAAAVRAVRTGTCQRLQARIQGYLEAMARHGTTTVEVKTGCALDIRAETKLFRVMAGFKNRPIEIVPTFHLRPPAADPLGEPGSDAAWVEWLLREYLPKIRRRRFARFADFVWDDCPERQDLYSRFLRSAAELEFGCKVHADHFRPAQAIALALHHSAVSVDHLEHASAADAAMLAGSSTMATLLPNASFCTGGRHAPGRAFIDAGVAVALGSNFNRHHTPTLNMQSVVALACMWMGMTPAEAISAATINSAQALGCADRVGSLDLGKQADLVILNVSDYREVAHHFGMNLVHMTVKRGELIYKEGDVSIQPSRVEQPGFELGY